MKYSKDTIMEKHSYGNSLIRDFYFENDLHNNKKKTINICTFVLVLVFFSIKCISNLPYKYECNLHNNYMYMN